LIHLKPGPSITALLLEVVTVVGAVPLCVCAFRRPDALMVITVPMEILLNEVSPKVTPLPFLEVCAIRNFFSFPVHEPDWVFV
jgi:hypothetical protein